MSHVYASKWGWVQGSTEFGPRNASIFSKAPESDLYPYGGFHQWGFPKNGWFMRESFIKMDDVGLGPPPFQETPISRAFSAWIGVDWIG